MQQNKNGFLMLLSPARLAILLLLACALNAPALAAGQKAHTIPSFLPGGVSRAPIQIEAEKLNYFSKERKAVYSGHVVAKQGSATLSAHSLSIFMDEETKTGDNDGKKGDSSLIPSSSGSQIRRMEAEGNVVVTQKD